MPSEIVEIKIEPVGQAERRGEPIHCGLPFPKGMLRDPDQLTGEDEGGQPIPLQARVLDRWTDGSVRWLLVDWQANVRGPTRYRFRIGAGGKPAAESPVTIEVKNDGIVVATGKARFHIRAGGRFPFESVMGDGPSAFTTLFAVQDSEGQVYTPQIDEISVEEQGSLRAMVRMAGALAGPGLREPLANLTARLHFYAGSATVRIELTICNPRKAGHPGNLWTLGSAGSVYIRDAALTFALPRGFEETLIRCSPEIGQPFETFPGPLELYQDSSGGDNWQSSNHVNRNGVVPNSFCGYVLLTGAGERVGKRATPIVALERGQSRLTVAMQHFWQNFPKALDATKDEIILRLFPRQYADVHEIQGGEQKTHSFVVAFGADQVTAEPLEWCRIPLLASASPEWYVAADAAPYLTSIRADGKDEYQRLVDLAILGEDTFERKREVVDEYGWRHFGELYADHEGVFHQGPGPLVSHYNNQYDPLFGCGCQFLRSGDRRWWALMDDLARHVIDIDIYHTNEDRALYNHGLFWHTVHYIDAGTSTHRSYPKAPNVPGGGPGDEHNYTAGLLLHHFLTGSPASRQAVIDLAQWVVDMDDGSKTILRWLSRGCTGWASVTVSADYHGPGRGAGNSINALLDGHRLTGLTAYLDKAEQLIRRCINPSDDIERCNLRDPEHRWSYLVFLQALGRYLDYKAEKGRQDRMTAYARASLLHYARWMAAHEAPFLDKPDLLTYPTETWPAQDMRKREVFRLAARHAQGRERDTFMERSDFFFHYVTQTLSGMETRSLARPVVVLLSNGFQAPNLEDHGESEPLFAQEEDFGAPEVFVPQKVRAKRRLAVLAGVAAAVALAVGLAIGLVCWMR